MARVQEEGVDERALVIGMGSQAPPDALEGWLDEAGGGSQVPFNWELGLRPWAIPRSKGQWRASPPQNPSFEPTCTGSLTSEYLAP